MGARQADIDEASQPQNKCDQKGIKWERTCTDVICCLFFTVFLAAMVVLSVFAFRQGDPMKIVTPFDSVGNKCGSTNQGVEPSMQNTNSPVYSVDLTEFPYKMFTKPTSKTNMFSAVCVKTCPRMGDTAQCFPNSENTDCITLVYDTAP